MAIIIVTFNNERHIPQLIESIDRHVDTSDTPVVVVDNNSSDRTLSLLKEYKRDGIEILPQYINHGFGVGNNIGMAAIDADYYFLLNSDARLISDSHLQALAILEEDRKLGIAGLPLIFPDGSPQSYCYPYTSSTKILLQFLRIHLIVKKMLKIKVVEWVFSLFPISRPYVSSHRKDKVNLCSPKLTEDNLCRDADWVCGAAMVISKQVISSTGGFDSNIFLYGEDEDLCIQAKKYGYKVQALNVIPVVHEFGWGKNKGSVVVSNAKYQSLVYFINKNHSGLKRILLLFLIRIKHKGMGGVFNE